MDELKMLENDILSLFPGLPDELDEETKEKTTKAIIRDFFIIFAESSNKVL